jgi:hypothetical protein
MELLPKKFTQGEFTYTQLVNKSPYYIYEQASVSDDPAYEVIVATQNEAGERFGKMYPKRETYPPAESWGKNGFTFSDRGQAGDFLSNLMIMRERAKKGRLTSQKV